MTSTNLKGQTYQKTPIILRSTGYAKGKPLKNKRKMEKKGHFVLIHGASHGAWCWYKVIPQLKSMGHKVTAMDMTGAGIHPKQVHEVQSISDYFEPLMNFMASLQPEEKVILVGHSMGGYCISAAMERYPEKVAVAVFAAAYMASPTLPFATISQQVHASAILTLYWDLLLTFMTGYFSDSSKKKWIPTRPWTLSLVSTMD